MRKIVVTPQLRAAIDWAIKYFSKEVPGKNGFYQYEPDKNDLRVMREDFAADVFDLDESVPSYLRHNTLHAVLSYYLNENDEVLGRELWNEFMAMRMDCPNCGPNQINWIGYEYDYNHPKRYDGVSVWIHHCGTQIDRFTHRVLQPLEYVDVSWDKVHG